MDGSVQNRGVGPPRAGIAERIWESARVEFSRRGYHGARVQGIARGASCNVALMYRHWASKKALYADILRGVWLRAADEIGRALEDPGEDRGRIVEAHLDAMMRDPMGAQILIRELLDGAPHLGELARSDPAILETFRRSAAALGGGNGRVDPVLAVVMLGGLAALVASARETALSFLGDPVSPEEWRRHASEILAHGVARIGEAAGANGAGL